MKQHEEMQEMRNAKNHRDRQENWLGVDRREDRHGACVAVVNVLVELINSHLPNRPKNLI